MTTDTRMLDQTSTPPMSVAPPGGHVWNLLVLSGGGLGVGVFQARPRGTE